MDKAVLKLEIHDDEEKKEVMKTVSDLSGVDSISMDMKEKKLTVIGDIDPVNIVSKLRKPCHTEIVSVEPAKEPEKKKDDGNKKKDEPKIFSVKKKDDGNKKKYQPKKEPEIASVRPAKKPEKKKDDGNKKKYKPKKKPEISSTKILKVDKSYNPHMLSYASPKSADDDTSCCACVIL